MKLIAGPEWDLGLELGFILKISSGKFHPSSTFEKV